MEQRFPVLVGLQENCIHVDNVNVTYDSNIYFEWNDKKYMFYCKDGFSLMDVIRSVQDILSKEKRKGLIEGVKYNPKTKQIKLEIMYC